MTENAKKHIDSCRFCWMCRHICPIGNATGLERNTARARALGLSLVNRGVFDLGEVIDNVYECASCGACTKECVTGWDPVMFLKEARLDAALEGKLPEYINVLVDNIIETGNAYGKRELSEKLASAIAAHSEKEKLCFFLGVDARYMAPEAAVTAISAMEKTGVPFTVLMDEPASGQQLEYLISAAAETKEQMVSCAGILGAFETVVVYDPQDAKVMKHEYAEWGVELKPEIVTFTAFLARCLENGTLKAEKRELKAVYQDPFQLARDLKETEEPRKVISAYAELSEMLCHGKNTMWAGGILMAQWMEDVMEKVAADRLRNVRGVGADTVITASVSEYVSLKKVKQDAVRVLSIEELICGGK